MAAITSSHYSKITEKKMIDEKIGKVKEIVKNISNNDIMLALYNFDLDVERTIHAFCEGGSQTALGDWEKFKTGGKKRNNKKKSKAVTDDRSNGDGSQIKGTESISSISSATYSTGYTNQTASSTINNSLAFNNKNLVNAENLSIKENTLLSSKKTEQELFCMNAKSQIKSNVATLEANEYEQQQLPNVDSIHADVKVNFNTETETIGKVFDFDDNLHHLKEYKSTFDAEILTAQTNIQQCFKELYDALSLREQQLLAELSDCKRDGYTYFTLRENTLRKMHNNKQQDFDAEKFNLTKIEDLETALTARFISEGSSSLIPSIQNLGKVTPVKIPYSIASLPPHNENDKMIKENTSNTITDDTVRPACQNLARRSNSPSSLVSSADSGLGGQISPLNQEKGPVVQVEENGIMLKSDSISADQLIEIQRNIMESLKAKGIDPSVLNNTTTTAHRQGLHSNQQSPGRAEKTVAKQKNNNRNENGTGKKQHERQIQQHKN